MEGDAEKGAVQVPRGWRTAGTQGAYRGLVLRKGPEGCFCRHPDCGGLDPAPHTLLHEVRLIVAPGGQLRTHKHSFARHVAGCRLPWRGDPRWGARPGPAEATHPRGGSRPLPRGPGHAGGCRQAEGGSSH